MWFHYLPTFHWTWQWTAFLIDGTISRIIFLSQKMSSSWLLTLFYARLFLSLITSFTNKPLERPWALRSLLSLLTLFFRILRAGRLGLWILFYRFILDMLTMLFVPLRLIVLSMFLTYLIIFTHDCSSLWKWVNLIL